MGTLSWSVTESGRYNKNVQSSRLVSSGTFSSTTSAANVTSLTTVLGDVVVLHADEAMRVAFNGTSATNTGHYIPAGIQREFEITQGNAGAVSVTDVA